MNVCLLLIDEAHFLDCIDNLGHQWWPTYDRIFSTYSKKVKRAVSHHLGSDLHQEQLRRGRESQHEDEYPPVVYYSLVLEGVCRGTSIAPSPPTPPPPLRFVLLLACITLAFDGV